MSQPNNLSSSKKPSDKIILPSKGKILALDLGTRRTGVAISDEEQKIAFPRDELEHESMDELIEKLSAIVEKDEVTAILVGLPINMIGVETKQTHITKGMIKELKASFQIPIYEVDERLSTSGARQMATGNRAVDSLAAQFILEIYLS
jgi:putative Holliday junction resolvase